MGQGQIIWEQENHKNRWICFRKTVHAESEKSDILFKIAVDTKYWLYINGSLAVFDGGLLRESRPGCGYYDEIDITGFIRTGANVIAVMVWYWGNEGRNNVDSGAGGLLFECPALGVYSDESCKMLVHPAYTETGEPYPAYLYGGYNIGFDARKDIGDWQSAGYDDGGWRAPAVKPGAPWGTLYQRPVPQFRFSGLKNYTATDCERGAVTARLPHACHLTPYFKVRAEAGLKIDIRTDRYAVNGGPGDEWNTYRSHRTEYITKSGVQEFESLDWLFGEQVIYTFPEQCEVLEVKYRESGYDTSFAGRFRCENGRVNRLLEKCERTLYVCMRDNFMDCPDRERGQWIGDVSVQVPQVFYVLDRSADALIKKAVSDFIRLRRGGVLVGNVPGTNFSELPAQSLNAVSELGMMMQYYLYSGDERVIFDAYPAVKAYLLLFAMGKDGLAASRSGDWYWFDHLDHVDSRVLENCWYYSALSAACKFAEIAGHPEDKAVYAERMQSIREHFHRCFWRGDGYRSGDVNDDRANAMAVLTGLADKGQYPALRGVFQKSAYATPYMEYYVLEAMFQAGFATDAAARMLRRYGPLIENENTTLWEDFAILGTRNHAWSGGPLTVMYKYVAGIRPAGPGFEEIAVLPVYAGLNEIEAEVLTVKGRVSVSLSYGKDQFILKADIPEDCACTLGIPADCFGGEAVRRITHNGRPAAGEDGGAHILLKAGSGEQIVEAFPGS